MKINNYYVLFLLILISLVYLDAKKISKSRSSGRSSNRKTNYNPQPAPTSHSYSQSAAKPTLFGWQQKPVQRSQASSSSQSKTSQSHSYPSSQTGLSGKSAKQPSNQDNIQKSHTYPQSSGANPGNQQQSHGYPASSGMSGQSKPGAGYPSQQGGLSGNAPKQPPSYQESVQKSNSYSQNSGNANTNQQNHAYPSNHGLSGNSGTGVGYPSHQGPPPQYSGNNYMNGAYGPNYGNNHRPPPPPYPGNFGPSHGYGGYNTGYGSQMPGYFGNYGNNVKGFGGMSRGSALTGVGIAGAGVGTLLTGLALWNLARSTGHRHHTVIYDNRGQPVAVAPSDNSTNVDPILGELVNCTLTISSINATEVLAIPCSIATSFTPEADVKDSTDINNDKDSTKCTVTVVTKSDREFMTTIPCSILLNTAAENNVTEAPEIFNGGVNGTNGFDFKNDSAPLPQNNLQIPSALVLDTNNTYNNCNLTEPGMIRDPINPCYAITYDVSVHPLPMENDTTIVTTSTPLPVTQ